MPFRKNRVISKAPEPVSANILPQPKQFRCTKDLFTYARSRCVKALGDDKPREYAVLADIRSNKVLAEYLGGREKCELTGMDKLHLDKDNTILLHGHPDGAPISPRDIFTLLHHNISQVIAFDSRGDFSLVAKMKKLSKNILKSFDQFHMEHCDLYYELTPDGEHKLYNLATDDLLKKYSPKMGIRYITNYHYVKKNNKNR